MRILCGFDLLLALLRIQCDAVHAVISVSQRICVKAWLRLNQLKSGAALALIKLRHSAVCEFCFFIGYKVEE